MLPPFLRSRAWKRTSEVVNRRSDLSSVSADRLSEDLSALAPIVVVSPGSFGHAPVGPPVAIGRPTGSLGGTPTSAGSSLSPHTPAAVCNASMIREPTEACLVPPQAPQDAGKYTIVLDLDETLVYARDGGPVAMRPYLSELMLYLGTHCEVIIWTAGSRKYARSVIKKIDPKGKVVRHCVYRHNKWFLDADGSDSAGQELGSRKELSALGRDLSKTLLLDNNPECCLDYPQNAIICSDFLGGADGRDGPRAIATSLESISSSSAAAADTTLLVFRQLVAELVAQQACVPQFVVAHPKLLAWDVQSDVWSDNGVRIELYFLPNAVEEQRE